MEEAATLRRRQEEATLARGEAMEAQAEAAEPVRSLVVSLAWGFFCGTGRGACACFGFFRSGGDGAVFAVGSSRGFLRLHPKWSLKRPTDNLVRHGQGLSLCLFYIVSHCGSPWCHSVSRAAPKGLHKSASLCSMESTEAYRQVPILPSHSMACVVVWWHLEWNTPAYQVYFGMLFGLPAVTAFRVPRTPESWHVVLHVLR